MPRLRGTRAARRALAFQAVHAVAQFLQHLRQPPGELLSDEIRPDQLSPNGLNGQRVLHVAAAQAAALEGKSEECIRYLRMARASIKKELDKRDYANNRHLRLLSALLDSLLAVRLAESCRDGTAPRGNEARRLAREATELAKKATDAAPQEPYLYRTRAYTSFCLGEPKAGAAVLENVQDAAWVSESWKESLSTLRELCKLPYAAILKFSPGEDCLRAVCGSRLKEAGAGLPRLLDWGAGQKSLDVYTIHLHYSRTDLAQGVTANTLLGNPEKDTERSPTILGLQQALRKRFGVALPRVKFNELTPPGIVEARANGTPVTTALADTREAEELSQSLGLPEAPLPLKILALAAVRMLDQLPPSSEVCESPWDHDRWSVLAADRIPLDGIEADLRHEFAADDDAAAVVGALRLSLCVQGKAASLWGNEAHRQVRLLDIESEAALQAGIPPAFPAGLIVSADLFRRLSRALTAAIIRRAPEEDQREGDFSAPALPGFAAAPTYLPPALAVRNSALRPLVRALIRSEFPEVPVLALSEVEHREIRVKPIAI